MATGITKLPIETLGEILRKLDSASTLRTTINSSKLFLNAFRHNSMIVRDILRSRLPKQLLPYAIAVYQARRFGPATNPEVETRSLLDTLYTSPINLLPHLATVGIAGAIEIERMYDIIHRYSLEMTEEAFNFIESNPAAVTAEKPASTAELLRICLAFYRVELYFNLFRTADDGKALVSLQDQRAWFFDRHSFWANEQIGCIHDFLEWKITLPLRNVASHDVWFGEMSVDYLSTGIDNEWMQKFMSQGLFFIEDLAQAGDFQAQRELLTDSFGRGRASLAESLLSIGDDENDYTDCVSLSEYRPENLKDSCPPEPTGDIDSGPFTAWFDLNQDQSPSQSVFMSQNACLRQAAYVFWDKSRLRAGNSRMLKRFHEVVDNGDVRDPCATEDDFEKMWMSFEERSKIWSKGGRGYWDENDESKVQWPSQ